MGSRTRNIATLAGAALLTAVSFAGAAKAETVVIEMLNINPANPGTVMVYNPGVTRANVGDTIVFKSVDPAHNAVSIEGMIPAGAEPFNSPISQDFEYVVTEEGTYGFYCVPHSGLGMAGLILVGDHTVNLEEAKAVRHSSPLLGQRFQALFAEVE
ncbi:MAG: plastocyanin/azurin family copper-binding protein, partial [Pseudomonadota bacterium]